MTTATAKGSVWIHKEVTSVAVFCLDVNECFNDNGYCEGLCVNTQGGYECSCFPGYMIDSDNTTQCNGELYEFFTDRNQRGNGKST